jgi:hypothetical protein
MKGMNETAHMPVLKYLKITLWNVRPTGFYSRVVCIGRTNKRVLRYKKRVNKTRTKRRILTD